MEMPRGKQRGTRGQEKAEEKQDERLFRAVTTVKVHQIAQFAIVLRNRDATYTLLSFEFEDSSRNCG